MDLEITVLSKRSQSQNTTYYMNVRTGKSVYRDIKKTSGCLRFGVGGGGYGASFWGWWKCSKLNVVMVAQLCEHTKNYWTAYFKWMSCTVYGLCLEFYLNKAFPKKILANICQSSRFVSIPWLAHRPPEVTPRSDFAPHFACSTPNRAFMLCQSESVCWIDDLVARGGRGKATFPQPM